MSLTDEELLSAYLDRALSSDEQRSVEARLTAEPAFRTAYDELSFTRSLLRRAPELAPPRDFRLDPARYVRRPRILALPRAVTGLAAIAASVLLVSLYLLTKSVGLGASSPASGSQMAQENASPTSQAVAYASTPLSSTLAAPVHQTDQQPSVTIVSAQIVPTSEQNQTSLYSAMTETPVTVLRVMPTGTPLATNSQPRFMATQIPPSNVPAPVAAGAADNSSPAPSSEGGVADGAVAPSVVQPSPQAKMLTATPAQTETAVSKAAAFDPRKALEQILHGLLEGLLDILR